MRIALIALGLVLALIVALAAALPWLAEPALRAGLRLAALDRIDFQRLQLGWDSLEVQGITTGQGGQELARLRVDYRLPDLLDGRLGRVEIEGLVVRAAWRDGRLQLAGFETSDRATAGASLPLADVADVVLRDAHLELGTALGTVQLPFAAQVRRRGRQLTFDATSNGARLDGIEGTLEATLTLEGALPGDAPITLETVQASGAMTLLADHADLGIARDVDGEARLGFDLAAGRLDLDLALERAALNAADLALGGVSLRQRTHWRLAADRLTVQAADAGTVAIERLAAPDLRAGPLRLRLEPGPLLDLAIGQGGPAAWQQSATAVIETAALHLAAPALDLESRAGSVTLALEGAGAELIGAEIVVEGGGLTLPQHALALEGIATQARLTPAGPVPDREIPITIARLRHGGRPAWFAPLTLQGALVPGAEGVAFEARLSRIGGAATLDLRGEHGTAGLGRATVALPPVTFGPSLQPKDLAPIVAGLVSEVTGQIALDGELRWDPGGLAGGLAVLVDRLGLSAGPARLEQVSGVIQLDRLWPPATPPGQQLAIGLLDLGLPLTEGLTTFQLLPGPRIDVSQLTWHLAGGTARAEPFSLGSALEGTNVTLRAEQLDLGALLELTKLDGLSGEGSLDGVLPIRLSAGAASVEGGELAATGPGVLRYSRGAAPAALQSGVEGVDLLLQALENFHYGALRITLDGRTDAAMDIGLHLGGANPDLYDGHPIEFNLDLQGELGNILRRGVASYQIPDRVRERMQRFGR